MAEHLLSLALANMDFQKVVGNRRYLRFRGKLSFLEGNKEEATGFLTDYIRRYGYESDPGLLVARAFNMLGADTKAAYWYDRFIAKTPRYPAMAEILWRRAWIEEERGNPAAAGRFYQKIYKKYPRSGRADESLLRHGLCLFRTGHYAAAIQPLSRLESHYPAPALLLAAGFWKARSWLKLDSIDLARNEFMGVIRRDPYDYYAHRSSAILASLGDTLGVFFPGDTIVDTAAVIRWFDSISPLPEKFLTAVDSINLRRAIACALVGRMADAEFFFEPVELSNEENLSLRFRIAQFYQRVGAFSQAVQTGKGILRHIPAENRGSLPLLFRRLLFPGYYSDIIKREAARWNVGPSLVYAVIRQESVFDSGAVSHAGAIGLMQIMPETGRKIAGDLGESFVPDTLFTPAENIRFGTYYLHTLLDRFDNSCEFSLAGYNGGPPKAGEWLLRNRKKEKDIDLLIEGIDFPETRTYVKKVMANYWFYQALDGK